MRTLRLDHLKLALTDLLEKRHADLMKSRAGKFFEPTLVEQRSAIDALPDALTGGRPLSAELETQDDLHDGFGGCIYHTVEAVLRNPDSGPELVAAASRVREAFVPSLSELKDSYPTEARRATERRPLLTTLKSDLERFPLPGGCTLYEVATKFIAAGETLTVLLSQRADVSPHKRGAAGQLRAATVGTLFRLRAELGRELSKNPALPKDLEHRVFGYIDSLVPRPRSARPAEEPPAPPVTN